MDCWEGRGEKGEVSPQPVTKQEGELGDKQGMQETHWARVPYS